MHITYDEFAHRVGLERFKLLKAAGRLDQDLQDGLDYITSLTVIDLEASVLTDTLAGLVAANIWTQDDVDEIMNPPVEDTPEHILAAQAEG